MFCWGNVTWKIYFEEDNGTLSQPFETCSSFDNLGIHCKLYCEFTVEFEDEVYTNILPDAIGKEFRLVKWTLC